MLYYTTRAFPTASRQYEAGDAIDPASITAAEWIKGTESGAVVPARWYGTAAELAARGIPGPGVPVYETDTMVARVGDGITSVASLPQVGMNTYGQVAAPNSWLGTQTIDVSGDPGVGPEQAYRGYRGRWRQGIDVANSPTSRDFVMLGQDNAYYITDGATTASSTTLTSATEGAFISTMSAVPVSGTGIPSGTTATYASATTLTMSAAATATATGVRVLIGRPGVGDLMYVKHRGAQAPTFGIGVTPPDGSHRLQLASQNAEPAMGILKLLKGSAQTGNCLTVSDSGDVARLWIDKDFYLSGNHPIGGGVFFKGDATNERPLAMVKSDTSVCYGFTYSGNSIRFRYVTGGVDSWEVGTAGRFKSLAAPDFSATGAQMPHAGASTPSGGQSGEVRVGTGKIWVNDAGTWKSVAVA